MAGSARRRAIRGRKEGVRGNVDKAIKEDDEGDISADTLKPGHDFINGLRASSPPRRSRGPGLRDDASRFVKTFAGLVRLLEKPDTTEAFNQLRKVQTTPLSNLIAFMEIYNLRFGQATTPRQRQIYRDLFAQIDTVRDRGREGSQARGIRGGPARSSGRHRLLQQAFPRFRRR